VRRRGDQTRLTDEWLTPFVEEIRQLARVHQVLEDTVPATRDVETAGWEAFRRDTPSLPETDWEIAWELVFDQICKHRAAEREAAERALAARFPALFKLEHVNGGWVAELLAAVQVRYPAVPTVFAVLSVSSGLGFLSAIVPSVIRYSDWRSRYTTCVAHLR
jgi:hypothetical protein